MAMLSDAQNWAIVSAADEMSTAVLARALGVGYSTVNNARWRYRREGWTCGVQYVACEECGGVLTNDLPANARRRFHPGCRAQGRERVVRAGHVRRWAVKSEFQREAIRDRGTAYQADAQAASMPVAVNRGALWSAAEDAYLLERVDLDSTATLAKALGSTYCSVIGRRHTLRVKGIIE
ncbi:MAG: hypothetical protein ACR2OE_06445 [Thermomicrobiales bacterium]